MGKLIRLANTKDLTDGTMKKYQVCCQSAKWDTF